MALLANWHMGAAFVIHGIAVEGLGPMSVADGACTKHPDITCTRMLHEVEKRFNLSQWPKIPSHIVSP